MGQLYSQAAQRTQEQQQSSGDQTPFMFRMGARAVGAIAGVLAMFLGIWVLISTSAGCVIAGLLQMIFGFLIIALEAPCCCMWFDFIARLENFSQTRPFWQKAILYGIMGLLPNILCFFSTSAFFGAGLIFVDGVIYGIMALGKKADRDTMMTRAGEPGQPPAGAPPPYAPTGYDAWDSNVNKNAALP